MSEQIETEKKLQAFKLMVSTADYRSKDGPIYVLMIADKISGSGYLVSMQSSIESIISLWGPLQKSERQRNSCYNILFEDCKELLIHLIVIIVASVPLIVLTFNCLVLMLRYLKTTIRESKFAKRNAFSKRLRVLVILFYRRA